MKKANTKRVLSLILIIILLTIYSKAQVGYNITSWQRNTNGAQGQYYSSDGVTVNSLADSSGVLQVGYNTDTIYIRTGDLGAFIMGPWPGDPYVVSAQNYSYVFKRNPTYPSSTHQPKATGTQGVQVNGVVMYDDGDGKSYNTSTNTNNGTGAGVWNQIAWISHAGEMDAGNGHPDPGGDYHNHFNPIQLCSVTDDSQHSPIIGWAFDGWPIYGPFGYSSAMDNSSAIARMTPSWSLRSITSRTTLYDGTTTSQVGPDVSTTFPLGIYIEDYEYIANSGDLDYYNGRYCVTPEYPSGTYAYFLNTDAAGNASYPNMIGPKYYGSVYMANFGATSGSASAPVNGFTWYTTTSSITATLDSQTNVSCNGLSDGSATVSATGGSGSYTYSWSPSGGNSATATGLSAGDYTCTIGDGTNTATQTVTITEPNAISISVMSADPTCSGNTDGTINLTVSGGSSYGQGSPGLLISELQADPNGSDANKEFVEMVATKEIDFSVTPYTVVFSTNGTATDNGWVEGKTVSYAFQISSGSVVPGEVVYVGGVLMPASTNILRSRQTATQLGDGNLGWSGLDKLGNGGSAADAAAVFDVGVSSLTSSTVPIDAIFYGSGLGTAVRSSGTAGYQLPVNDMYSGGKLQSSSPIAANTVTGQYLKATGAYDFNSNTWTSARSWANTSTFTNLATSVNVTGAYNFSWSNGSTSEDLSGLAGGTYSVIVTDSTGCSNTATVTLTTPAPVTGSVVGTNVNCNGELTGAADLTPAGGNSTYTYSWSNSGTTEDLDSIAAGTYSVTITDGKGCTGTANVTITEPASPMSVSSTNTLSSCSSSTGSIDLTVSGGTASYTYQWSNGATTEDLSSLSAGTYSVVVTDANSCTDTTTINVSNTSAPSLSSVVTDLMCNGDSNGAIDLTVSGGTPTYTYSWSNGSTNEDISSLTAGDYTVTVTDANGCATITTIAVSEPTTLSISTSETMINCNGEANGAIDLTVSGGTPTYSYLWSNGSTSEDISSLNAGTYSITITDANSCVKTSTILLTEPTALSLSTSATDVLCNGTSDGTIDLTVGGGTASYIYVWSNTATTEDLSSLAAGTYSVTVTDANSCTATATVTITEPTAVSLSLSGTDITCNGASTGSVDLTVSGGTAGYSYSWSNGATTEDITSLTVGTYSVTVTDVNSCTATANITLTEASALNATVTGTDVDCFGNSTGSGTLSVTGGTPSYSYAWSNGTTSQNLTSVSAGTYSVTITDVNSCTGSLTVTISQPSTALSLTSTTVVSSCTGSTGSVDLTVSGGTSAYSYSWSNGAATEDLSSLAAGSYSVEVTDANSCVATTTVTVSTATGPGLATSSTDVDCNGNSNGSIDLTVTGGTTPFTYMWDNGATTEDISSLSSGTYSVTVTDVNGCSTTTFVTITEPTALSVSTLVTNVNCYGDLSGALDLTVTGGTANYSYSWSNGAISEDLSGLAAGTYSATITDANNCVTTVSETITEPSSALSLSTAATDASCSGGDGSIDLTVMGGTSGYSYSWSNGQTTEDVSSLNAGSYSVTVIDANGCTQVTSEVVGSASGLSIFAFSNDLTCNGSANGSIDITISGGTPSYTYSWSNSATSEDLTSLSAGIYSVTVTDMNGCTITETYTLTEPPVISISDVVTDETLGNDGAIDVTVLGGTVPYTYMWSNSSVSEDLNGLTGGDYTVVVTDANGCQQTTTITVASFIGVKINQESTLVSVYPNPVTDKLHLSFENSGALLKVVVADMQGKAVFVNEGEISEIDMSYYLQGVYTLHLVFESETAIYRIVKQ